ncbi:NnrU family protein [Ottowia sp. GY511]|uniref:NnrU family protein n=1 Tax=Ottowia flava TaxID=2675430 RepID=A0ABW4KXI5_9BURK|nr:NnrU family protein [Ottowia sp. GY511]TXK28574.1 NnrU family protein [Ottowia sp. GY511]
MTVLILGLVLFLGAHSVRIFADGWRTRTIASLGDKGWKAAYSVVSLIGFGLIVWGYGLARQQPVVVWSPPVMMKHLNSLFTLVAFVFLAAAYVPRNQIRAKLHHPMVLGVKLWAFGHLLATGKLADMVLFGAFLLWAVLDFRAARQRDRALGTVYAPGTLAGTLIAVVVGAVAWAVFAFWLHAAWIGVAPLGRTL